MTDDNNGSLRERGLTYLDKPEVIKHGFAVKYLFNNILYVLLKAPKCI